MGVLQMSISAGALVIAIALTRTVALNRLPKKMFLTLWGVALIRFLIPVSIPLPFSISDIVSNVTRTVLHDITSLANENPINTGDVVIKTPGRDAIGAAQDQVFSIFPTTTVWLAGTIALFMFLAVIYFKNHRRLRYATEIRDNDYLNEWLAEYRVTRPIAIMQSDRIETPLAVGIFKPRVILPKSMDMDNRQLLDYVLTHECYHIKRHDAVWKILMLLALCVHWFNPMAWLMFVLASRDLELTCDEAVVDRYGASTKKAYSYMLIGLAEQQARFAPLFNGFSRNATEERIVSIMKLKKKSLVSMIVACVVVVTLAIGALSGSVSANDNSNSKKDPIVTNDVAEANASPQKADELDLVGNLQAVSSSATALNADEPTISQGAEEPSQVGGDPAIMDGSVPIWGVTDESVMLEWLRSIEGLETGLILDGSVPLYEQAEEINPYFDWMDYAEEGVSDPAIPDDQVFG